MTEAYPEVSLLRLPAETVALRAFLNDALPNLGNDPIDILRHASIQARGNSIDLIAHLLGKRTLEKVHGHIKNFPVKLLSQDDCGEIRYGSQKGLEGPRAIVVPPQNIINMTNRLKELNLPLSEDDFLASSVRLVSGYAEGLVIFDSISPSHVFEEGERSPEYESVRLRVALSLLTTGLRGEIRSLNEIQEHVTSSLPHSYAATIMYAHLEKELQPTSIDPDMVQGYVEAFVGKQIMRVTESLRLGVVVSAMDRGMAQPLPAEDFLYFSKYSSVLYENGHSLFLVSE